MNHDVAIFRPLLCHAKVDLALAEALVPERPFSCERLIDLILELPEGLGRADTIWVVGEAPAGLEPFAPGGAWYGLGAARIVYVGPYPHRAARELARLTELSTLARGLRERILLHQAPLLLSEPLPSDEEIVAWALALEGSFDGLRQLEPEVWRELVALATRQQSWTVALHPSVRLDRAEEAGEAVAEALLERLKPGDIPALLIGGEWVFELLSPYPRDLGHALTAYGLEHAEALAIEGLPEALAAQRGHPDPELTALVAKHLLAAHPELEDERARADQQAGLEVLEHHGAELACVDFAALRGPDRRAIPESAEGTALVLSGGAPEMITRAVRTLLEATQIRAVVASCPVLEGAGYSVPEVVCDSSDAIALNPAEFVRCARLLGVDVVTAPMSDWSWEGSRAELALDVFRCVRRATVLGLSDPSTSALSYVLEPTSALNNARVAITAERLALRVSTSVEQRRSGSARDTAKSQKKLRFRA